jgi:hypothetical protein
VTASKLKTRMALIALLMLQACGLGGGSRGSGITSIADGNVAAVLNASASADRQWNLVQFTQPRGSAFSAQDAAVPVSGIKVTVEPGGQQSTTDDAGSFLVFGNFESQLTLVFSRPVDGIRASTPIDIPAGGTLTLHDVTIDSTSGVATPTSEEVDFTGQMIQINCTAQDLVFVSIHRTAGDTDSYTVRLATSSIVDPDGNPVACTALSTGDIAHVHGIVNADGSFGNAIVTVE